MARVLVVDDNPVARSVAAVALETAGLEVDEACDGQEAIEWLERDPPDAVVLDIMMPRLSGHDVLAQRRSRHLAPDTAVVMLSCKAEDPDVTRAFEAGAADYVTKPFDPDDLVRSVRAALYRRRH
ncbi:MAG TPA: response regulator [Acidimicrobiales bacterium]|nr:response regulator [Acidimicrobiales bacterium]